MNEPVYNGMTLQKVDDNFLINLCHMYNNERDENGDYYTAYYDVLRELNKRNLDVGDTYKKVDVKRKQRFDNSSNVPGRLQVLLDGDITEKSLTDRVRTIGREDVEDLFEKSGLFESERLYHTPFIVFVDNGDFMDIEIVDIPGRLWNYSDDTRVMVQWAGRYKSDFFNFTIGQARKYFQGDNQ